MPPTDSRALDKDESAGNCKADEPMDMLLCEFARIVPLPNRLYRPIYMPGCAACEKVAAEQVSAYGMRSPTYDEAAALSAAPQSDGWRPIEEGPEGVGVLCYQPLPNGLYLIFTGYRTGTTWRQVDYRVGAVEAIYEPTLFQHIKAPRTQGEES